MKFFFVILCSSLTVVSFTQPYRVMTYNIRYDTQKDGENCWDSRKEKVVQLIRYYEPHVLGIQEGLNHQVSHLDSSLTRYDFVGVGRDDGKRKGEYSAIFYDNTMLEVLESATFWLSDTPDRVSTGWDASMERICTYARFRNKADDTELWVFNTHFDHIGKQAQFNAAGLILEVLREKTAGRDAPVVLMGDLNVTPDENAISVLKSWLSDSREENINQSYGPEGTFNGFETDPLLERRIDYVFVKNAVVTSQAHIDDRRDNNLFPSDHLPVLVTFYGTR